MFRIIFGTFSGELKKPCPPCMGVWSYGPVWTGPYLSQEFETHRVVKLVRHAEHRRMVTTATVSAGEEDGAARSYSWPEVIVLVLIRIL